MNHGDKVHYRPKKEAASLPYKEAAHEFISPCIVAQDARP
jgi:hypothetical protein